MKQFESLEEAVKQETPSIDPVAAAREILDHIHQKNPTATHAILFVNPDMSSSKFGSWTVVAIGPDQTYKTLDQVEGGHLYDLPSQRQYPVGYVELKGRE